LSSSPGASALRRFAHRSWRDFGGDNEEDDKDEDELDEEEVDDELDELNNSMESSRFERLDVVAIPLWRACMGNNSPKKHTMHCH